MDTPTTSARRLRRSVAHCTTGLALAAALGVAGPTGSAPAAASPECDPEAPSSARLAEGADLDADPNTVSAEESAAMDAALDRKVAKLVGTGALRPGARAAGGPIVVRTHVHIIRKSDGSGGVTRTKVREQIRVMNEAFTGHTSQWSVPTRFRFELASIDVSRNDAWYHWNFLGDGVTEDEQARQAKRSLHKGGWGTLNIYTARLGDDVLGYATFPRTGPMRLDGLVVDNGTLPGGSRPPYNHGDTAVHEVGHWLNLFHTFQNGCLSPGDFVRDTPYQDFGRNIFFCGDHPDFGDDTCPQRPFKDPVHNFMSYSDDQCMNRFTRGQSRRMALSWAAYRAPR